jgi:hypothetical protein
MSRVSPSALRTLLCGVAALALSACGGEDDEGAAAPPPAGAGQLVISQANATRVTAEALGTLAASLSVSVDVLGVDQTAANARRALRRLAQATRPALRPPAGAARVRPLAVEELELDCLGGGTSTLTLSTATAGVATPGDFQRQTFNQCVEDGGVVRSGSQQQTLAATNANATLRTFDVVVDDLALALNGLQQSVAGNARVVANTTDANRPTSTTTSERITVTRRVNGTVASTHSITALLRDEVLDAGKGGSSFTTRMTTAGTFPSLGEASFQIETPQPLVKGADIFFASGQIKVTGSGNTSVLITALGDGAGGMNLKIDTNGDGVVDVEQTVTLTDLVAGFQTLVLP